jgi:hypothetical protein
LIAGIRAFVIAVLTAAAVGTVGALVLGVVQIWANEDPAPVFNASDLTLWLLLFIYLAVFAMLSLGIFGVALTAVLSRLRLERSWTYPLLGFAVGLAVALTFATPIGEPYHYEIFLFQLVAGALPGLAAGFVWWRLYRRSRALPADPVEAK